MSTKDDVRAALVFGIRTAPRRDDPEQLADHLTHCVELMLKAAVSVPAMPPRNADPIPGLPEECGVTTRAALGPESEEAALAKNLWENGKASPATQRPLLVSPDDPPRAIHLARWTPPADDLRTAAVAAWTIPTLIGACEKNFPTTLPIAVTREDGGQTPLKLIRNIISDPVINAVKIVYRHPAISDSSSDVGMGLTASKTLILSGGVDDPPLPADLDWSALREELRVQALAVFRSRPRTVVPQGNFNNSPISRNSFGSMVLDFATNRDSDQ